MCGRYQMSVREDEITVRFNVNVYEELYRPSYNCAPSQKLPVISNDDQANLSFFKWGLIPFWAKDPKIGYKMINAKAETIMQKPSFKNSFKRKRCLVISNGFYEWKKEKHGKIPFRIFLKDEKLFSFAGIWDEWKDSENRPVRTFSILTIKPNKLMEMIHNRMPVILEAKDEQSWLNEEKPEEVVKLLKPFPPEKMEAYKISSLVNSPRNDSGEIINPIEAA